MAIAQELQVWIADNIINGCRPEQLKPGLVALGISAEEADRELNFAAKHPYIQAGIKSGRAIATAQCVGRLYLKLSIPSPATARNI